MRQVITVFHLNPGDRFKVNWGGFEPVFIYTGIANGLPASINTANDKLTYMAPSTPVTLIQEAPTC